MFCQHQVVRLSLVNAHCAAHYSMHTKYTVQCTLCTLVNAHCAHYSMQTVHIIQCTVYTLFNAQCEHYSMHSVNTIQCTLHSVHNALHCTGPCCTAMLNARYAHLTIQCTVCTLHSAKLHWSMLHCNIKCTAQRPQCKTGRHCTTNGCIIKCTTRLHSNLMHWAGLFNAAACTILDSMSATLVPGAKVP